MYRFPKQGHKQTFAEKGEFTPPCLCSPLIFDKLEKLFWLHSPLTFSLYVSASYWGISSWRLPSVPYAYKDLPLSSVTKYSYSSVHQIKDNLVAFILRFNFVCLIHSIRVLKLSFLLPGVKYVLALLEPNSSSHRISLLSLFFSPNTIMLYQSTVFFLVMIVMIIVVVVVVIVVVIIIIIFTLLIHLR